jgi:hypothetical protein
MTWIRLFVFSSPFLLLNLFGMGEGHTGAIQSRFDSGRDNTITQIVHLFLIIPSRNPILQNASCLHLLELNQGMFVDVIEMPAFIP